MQGVVDVKQVPQGVAVYAENTFAALKGRDALNDRMGPVEGRDALEQRAGRGLHRQDRRQQGLRGRQHAATSTRRSPRRASQSLEAEIVFPFLAHAPMEPLDAVFVEGDDGSLDIYNGAQFPAMDQATAAEDRSASTRRR